MRAESLQERRFGYRRAREADMRRIKAVVESNLRAAALIAK